MNKIFLGVGHGGKDTGAVFGSMVEKGYNLKIALACRDYLIKKGVDVGMSRTDDQDDTLIQEINKCNSFSPQFAIDIHNNAGGGDGFEVYYHSQKPPSKALAQAIEKEVLKIGQNSRGCKVRITDVGSEYYGFIRQINCPSVIVECAFIDNPLDMEILNSEDKIKSMGIAIAKGVLMALEVNVDKLPMERAATIGEIIELLRVNGITQIKIG